MWFLLRTSLWLVDLVTVTPLIASMIDWVINACHNGPSDPQCTPALVRHTRVITRMTEWHHLSNTKSSTNQSEVPFTSSILHIHTSALLTIAHVVNINKPKISEFYIHSSHTVNLLTDLLRVASLNDRNPAVMFVFRKISAPLIRTRYRIFFMQHNYLSDSH